MYVVNLFLCIIIFSRLIYKNIALPLLVNKSVNNIKSNISLSWQVLTRAPIDCMCRPCTDVEEGTVLAQEIANFIQDSPMGSVPFLK